MKTAIPVKDRAEAQAIRTAMQDPSTRAFVTIVGMLLPRTIRSQRRILEFVEDKLDDERTRRFLAAARSSWRP
jgi:hypothetical protein